MKKMVLISKCCNIILLFLVIGLVYPIDRAQALSEVDLNYMTEQYPPFNFEEDGKLKGISIDLLLEIFKELGSGLTDRNIKVYPWAAGYKRTVEQKNNVLFATTRTEQRESLFKWVGPIAKNETLLILRKEDPLNIQNRDELNNYRYGVIRNDIGEQLMIQSGVNRNNLVGVTKMLTLIQMLKLKRIDAWVYGEYAAKWALKNHGFNPSDFTTGYVLSTSDLYYAFSKDTPNEIIQKFQRALDAVKSRPGVFDKILDTYLK
jgi:polar amino acid transport system substrate-binding protein